MYRFERILRDCMKLKKRRRERFVEQPVPVSLEDAVGEMEEAGGLVGAMEADGHLDVAALDAFEALVRGAVRRAVVDSDVIARTYNDLAPRLLHGRRLENRRDMTVARGLLALTQLAVEERIAIAVAAELSVSARWDHMTFPPSLDLGDRAYLRDKAARTHGAGGPANDDEPDGVDRQAAE